MLHLQQLFERRKIRLAIIAVIIIVFLIFVIEIALNLWIRSSLTASLRGEAPRTKIDASIGWLSMKDFFQGRVKQVYVNARNCRISDLNYLRFQLENQGFSFNMPLLFKKKRLQIIAAEKTVITAMIEAKALQEYLNLKHPGYALGVAIYSERIRLTGQAVFLGNKVPVWLEGRLINPTGKTIRFYPESLSIAGRVVPKDFLNMLGNQIPLEFSVLGDWPLQITEIHLMQGILRISMKEAASKR